MKLDPNAPASPRTISTDYSSHPSLQPVQNSCTHITSVGGLTIRAELAARMMAAMLTRHEWLNMAQEEAKKHSNGDVPANMAKFAVIYAKALENELNREEGL